MLISVIMPAFNNLKVLQRSLPAILDQKVKKPFTFEVVIIDDGSSDGSKKFLAAFKNKHLKLVLLEKNSGRSVARNLGIKEAKGEVLVFLDSDVIASPYLIQEHLKTLKITDLKEKIAPLVSSGRLINIYNLKDISKAQYKLRDFSAAHFATGNSAICRRFLEQVQENKKGPFDEDNFNVYGWEDLELGVRLSTLNLKYIHSSKAFAYHYCPPFDVTKISSYMKKEAERAYTANRFYHKHPTFPVRLMTQKTFFHRFLWEFLSLGGFLNERTLRPLLKWLSKKGRPDLAEALARNTFLNLNYVRNL